MPQNAIVSVRLPSRDSRVPNASLGTVLRTVLLCSDERIMSPGPTGVPGAFTINENYEQTPTGVSGSGCRTAALAETPKCCRLMQKYLRRKARAHNELPF